ncbi:MAG: 30S ribosomal protein S12 methylthiotransferase RimO, partial [Planctomycetaceae bacterium]
FITGFPGETDEQFEELREFVIHSQFQRMGVFTYSLEPGTPAERLDGQLPDDVKESRRDELMQVQQKIAFDFGESLVGYELDALIDSQVEEGVFLGRTFADAPEIDGNVYVTGEGIEVGQMLPVEVVESREYDLVGIHEPEADEPQET